MSEEYLENLTESLYGRLNKIDSSDKVNLILFDLDHTLIKPKDGRTFSKDSEDWEWQFDNIIKVLKEKYNKKEDYICIISNQKNLKKKEKEWKEFNKKVKNIIEEFKKEDINVSILVATEDDYFRKPLTGSFDYLIEYLKKNKVSIKKSKSFYCGDAAGRVYPDKTKDFDISDLYFSKNIGLEFDVPEVIFKGESNPEFKIPERKYLECDEKEGKSIPKLKMDQTCLILIMGVQASGKSYLAKLISEKYGCDVLETDKIKDKEKLKKKMEEKINNYKSVVVVGTFPKKEDRINLIKDLDKKKVFKVCIEMDTNKDLINHMNYFRVESSENKIKKIPEVAFRVYYKNYEEPKEEEGFNKVEKYKPCFIFENKKEEEMFMYYYPSK